MSACVKNNLKNNGKKKTPSTQLRTKHATTCQLATIAISFKQCFHAFRHSRWFISIHSEILNISLIDKNYGISLLRTSVFQLTRTRLLLEKSKKKPAQTHWTRVVGLQVPSGSVICNTYRTIYRQFALNSLPWWIIEHRAHLKHTFSTLKEEFLGFPT